MNQTPVPAFEFRAVTKAFGPVVANDRVSFSVATHALHGVVGENGAGKSTIMKILYGLYQPDAGEVLVRGSACRINSPEAAISLGIGMVHQHFMLVPTLTVWENIILGSEPSRFRLNREDILHKLSELQRTYGFALDLNARIDDLPVGHQQQVEILKLLYRDADILILDEPTAVLTPPEVDVLFEKLKKLWEHGKSVVLITHKLREILQFTHRVTVMRQGRVVETIATAGLDEESLAEKIVGRKRAHLPERKAFTETLPVLQVRNLSLTKKEATKPLLNGLSFHINAGEIVGIAGVEGNGQSELVEILANVNRRYQGEVLFHGTPLASHKTYEVKQEGLAVIPADRHREAVILDFSVSDNLLLGHHREPRFAKRGWFNRKDIAAWVKGMMERFDVRPRKEEIPIGQISGGNQQKAVIGREISCPVKLLIAAHPTRGVDIGAIEFIHGQCLKLRDEGAAILLVSSELDEILALSDRVLVMYEGAFVGEVTRGDAGESQIGRWMTGGER